MSLISASQVVGPWVLVLLARREVVLVQFEGIMENTAESQERKALALDWLEDHRDGACLMFSGEPGHWSWVPNRGNIIRAQTALECLESVMRREKQEISNE